MRGIDLGLAEEGDGYDLEALLHPAQAFDHPQDVVRDPHLSLDEKRAILASWASDACAVEAAPALRCAPGSRRVVTFDAVMEALRSLDLEQQRLQRQALGLEMRWDLRPRPRPRRGGRFGGSNARA